MNQYLVMWMDVQNREQKTFVIADSKGEAEGIVERDNKHSSLPQEARIDHIIGSVKLQAK